MSHLPRLSIQIVGRDEALLQHAELLSHALHGHVTKDLSEADYVLRVAEDGLDLRSMTDPDEPGLSIDLRRFASRFRGRSPGRAHPLGRAIGRAARSAIDATAGTGQDAMLLAAMGCDVQAIERSAVLCQLLEHALQQARADPANPAHLWAQQIRLLHGDARLLLADLTADVVFIDPMFPPKRNESALPRKSVRMIRELVGVDDDAMQLLDAARQSATRRVIVKRPDHVQPLMPDVTASYEGKLVRYDVYVD